MTASPPPLPVPHLIDDDAVDPGAEGGLAAETRNGPEDAQKNFLRQVERFVAIAQQVQRLRVDHPLVGGYQLGARGFVARGATLDERRFAAV